MQRIDRHFKPLDNNAIAMGLARGAEYRRGRQTPYKKLKRLFLTNIKIVQEDAARLEFKLRIPLWRKATNMRAVHQKLSQKRLAGTCKWF